MDGVRKAQREAKKNRRKGRTQIEDTKGENTKGETNGKEHKRKSKATPHERAKNTKSTKGKEPTLHEIQRTNHDEEHER